MTEHSKEVIEKRRAVFEAWNLAEQQSKWDEITKEYDLDVPMPDRFVEAASEVNWRIWNAALDSIEIELPAAWAAQMLDGDQVLQDCRYAIESTGLGLRVK